MAAPVTLMFGTKSFNVAQLILDQPVDFPRAKLTISKPTLHLYPDSRNLEEWCDTIISLIKSNSKISAEIVTYYLYHWALAKITAPLTEEWNSYGHVITAANTLCTIRDLFNVDANLTPDPTIVFTTNRRTEKEQNGLAFVLFSAHRYYSASNLQYRANLMDKFKTQWGAYQITGWTESAALTLGASWGQYAEYRKVIAGVDMLLSKFTGHELTHMRVATLSTRFLQCAALGSLSYFWDILGWNIIDSASYIWVESVATEVLNMVDQNEEISKLDSYLPYCQSLGVVNNCGFSGSKNPRFTIFCHAIGAFLGNPRSINAFFQTSKVNSAIIQNSIVVAYISHKTTQFKAIIRRSDIPQARLDAANDLPMNVPASRQGVPDTEPTSSDSLEWLAYIKDQGGITPNIEHWAQNAASKILNPRKGTMGEYIKQQYSP